MIVYRLAIETYKNDLSGLGSKYFGGRWNPKGLAALYTSENISLSVLEILVNADKNTIPPSYYLLKLKIPDTLVIKKISETKLKNKWHLDFEYSQFLGSSFLGNGKEVAIQVPSAIVKEEHNIILNPSHPDYKKISIIESNLFDLDIRLLKTNE